MLSDAAKGQQATADCRRATGALRVRWEQLNERVARCSVLIFAAAVGALGGCGPARAPSSAPLRVDLVAAAESSTLTDVIDTATHAGLVTFDNKGDVVPQLASSWRMVDGGRSVIFRVRPNLLANGRSYKASDVVAALRKSQPRGDPATFRFDAPVGDVVEVRSPGVVPPLLPTLAQPVFSAGPAVSGGFRAGSLTARPIMLSPIASGGAAVALTPVDDAGAAVARFARGRSDVVIGGGLAGFDDARLLAASNALRVELPFGIYGYRIRPVGPLADPRVRRALAMTIDRDDLGSRLFGVALTPVLGLVPPLPSTPAPALPDWAQQPRAVRIDLARQLLDAAGFNVGHVLTVTISLPSGREHANVAAEVATDWRAIGVVTQTVVRSPAEHIRVIGRGDYQLAMIEATSPIDTPLAFLTPFRCGADVGEYCNPGADGLIATARTAGAETAASTLAAAEAAMAADTPMIALFVPLRWALVAPRVTGWVANAGGHHPLAALRVEGRR